LFPHSKARPGIRRFLVTCDQRPDDRPACRLKRRRRSWSERAGLIARERVLNVWREINFHRLFENQEGS
jgi:hypothetical protein